MEPKFIIRQGVYFFSVFMFLACGYFDNDKVEFQKSITKNILIQKRENDKSTNLIFNEANNVSAIILDDCNRIYYDSMDKKIYAETRQNNVDRNYFQVNLLNSSAKYISDGTKKMAISKIVFEERTRNMLPKWEFGK